MRKNMNIELLRIISILMVILVHVYSDFMVRGLYYKSSTVLYVFSFFKICVPLFLIIMGYLYAIIGIYLLYPVFKVICRNEKLLLYLVIIGFIFTILIPTITGVFPDTAEFLQNFDYGFSYIIFYFLLGNYLGYLLPKISVNNYLFLLLYFIFIIINKF